MSFEIEQHERDGIPVVALSGRFVAGEPLEQFRPVVEALQAQGHKSAVLDMTGVNYIDSSALGALVVAHTQAEKNAGTLAMFGLAVRHLELMILTKLTTVFHLYESEADAVNHCIPGRAGRTFDILEFVEQQRAQKAGKGK